MSLLLLFRPESTGLTVVAQPCTITLTPVQGTITTGAVTVVAQPCTLTLTPVAGAKTTGAVTVTAQVCTITLTPVAGVITAKVTLVAQVCTITLTPVQGTITVGAITLVAQPCVLTLTPVQGAITTGAVTVLAQICTLTLQGVQGVITTGSSPTVPPAPSIGPSVTEPRARPRRSRPYLERRRPPARPKRIQVVYGAKGEISFREIDADADEQINVLAPLLPVEQPLVPIPEPVLEELVAAWVDSIDDELCLLLC